LSEKLYKEGYHYITNADFSAVVIEEMKQKYEDLDDMDYVEMDIAKPIEILDSDSFSCIIDKGCLDSVACSDEYSVQGH
jgi:hypothetical protein